MSVSAPTANPTQTPPPTVDAAQLVAQLPEPAQIADCAALTNTARDFIHAAAAVAAAEHADGASAGLVDRLRVLGDGYDSRTSELGCQDQPVVDQVRGLPRPSGEPSAAEILEFVLSGGDLSYPTPQPDSLNNGVAP